MKFKTNLAGVTMEGRQAVIEKLTGKETISIRHETNNKFDPNALAVLLEDETKIGYIPAETAARLAPIYDNGALSQPKIIAITGGGEKSFGVNIEFNIDEPKISEAELAKMGKRIPDIGKGFVYWDDEHHRGYDENGNPMVNATMYAGSDRIGNENIAIKYAEEKGLDPTEINAIWNNGLSLDYGTLVHKACELLHKHWDTLNLMKDDPLDALPMPKHIYDVMSHYREMFEISQSPSEVFVRYDNMCGTIDLLEEYDGVYNIVDFKTAKVKPAKKIREKYYKQLNFYRNILEKNGYKIGTMELRYCIDTVWSVDYVPLMEIEEEL